MAIGLLKIKGIKVSKVLLRPVSFFDTNFWICTRVEKLTTPRSGPVPLQIYPDLPQIWTSSGKSNFETGQIWSRFVQIWKNWRKTGWNCDLAAMKLIDFSCFEGRNETPAPLCANSGKVWLMSFHTKFRFFRTFYSKNGWMWSSISIESHLKPKTKVVSESNAAKFQKRQKIP